MNRTLLIAAAAVILGLGLGWLLFGRQAAPPAPAEPAPTMEQAEEAYGRGELGRAFELLQPLAEGGDALAMQRLGYMYAEGLHVEEDRETAISWLSRAVDAGNAAAGELLGQLLRTRALELGEDDPAAQRDLARAARLGDVEASALVGSYHLAGAMGFNQDYERATALLTRAAEGGDPRAQVNLGYMYATGTGVAADDVQARTWYRQAAEAGLVRAQTAYALFLETGRGGDANFEEAVRYYVNAAQAGARPAQLRLAALIVSGELGATDRRNRPRPMSACSLSKAMRMRWPGSKRALTRERDPPDLFWPGPMKPARARRRTRRARSRSTPGPPRPAIPAPSSSSAAVWPPATGSRWTMSKRINGQISPPLPACRPPLTRAKRWRIS